MMHIDDDNNDSDDDDSDDKNNEQFYIHVLSKSRYLYRICALSS